MSREPRISELTGADVGRYITICRGKTLNDGKRELVLRGMLEAVTHSGGVAHVHVSFDGGHFVYRDDRDGKVTVEDGDLGDIYWSDDS